MEAKELLGLDVGLKRTGLARASNVAKLAEPLKSVPTQKVLQFIKKYSADKKMEAIVIGLPRNLKGDDTEQTGWVRNWVDELKPKVQTPLYWQDEALSSVKAESLKNDSKSKDIDSISAAITLQDFLDSPETDRVMC